MSVCPNLETVALVVTRFGTDMRASHCQILPKVEVQNRDGESTPWSVAGISRGAAELLTLRDGSSAFGGTPNDLSVRQAITDLKARGLKVALYPFLMMDIPQENALPDPYGAEHQEAYGWRGNITCHPAIGRSGTPDQTANVYAQINSFVSGANGYRRMILHYANLAKDLGGVDLFLIGSELGGLSRLRDANNNFPFVDALIALSSEVRSILGVNARITYGADWSEYFGYHPQDGSGDVYFHLDKLWANENIDAVGIDNYMPVSDWRDEDIGLGNPDGFMRSDDLAAMKRAITSGEGFDWYYASDEARRLRQRLPIVDGL